jgi:drug/metabolite transporter (DMT)-like permease
MDKLLYLTFCLTNSLFYVTIKYVHLKYPQYSTTEVAAYYNIVSLFTMSFYLLKHLKKVVKNFTANFKMALGAPAAILKFMAIQYISPKNAMVISFLTPVAVTILSVVTLKETQSKKDFQRYAWMLLSFIGVVVFIGVDFAFSIYAYFLMLMHISAKAFIHIFTKQLGKDKYLLLFYNVFFNSALTIGVLLYSKVNPFSFEMLFHPIVLTMGVVSVLCQFALIEAYRVTSKISLLQNLDYSRIIFSCLGAGIILSESLKNRELLGIAIIFISIISSEKKEIKKRFFFASLNKKEKKVLSKEGA